MLFFGEMQVWSEKSRTKSEKRAAERPSGSPVRAILLPILGYAEDRGEPEQGCG
jgi:hypothetical protein